MNGNKLKLFVIFGGTGDLTFRKLLPAFYDLWWKNQIKAEDVRIVAIGRRDYQQSDYLDLAKTKLESVFHPEVENEKFFDMISYYKMDYTEEGLYDGLREYLQSLVTRETDHLFYLAVAPRFFPVISRFLKDSHILSDTNSKQLLIEKPFGDDLKSAISINQEITEIFAEKEIYRIDHYLAKEMLLNLITIRFGNTVFRQIWNKDSIASIQITASETIGVENRGDYYDHSGALEDMVQSHILQILSVLLMNEPASLKAEDLRLNQYQALTTLAFPKKGDYYVAGQYQANHDAVGYLEENRVAQNSTTETFVALKLISKAYEFSDVPIYIRTGKRMKKLSTLVAIEFKPTRLTQADEYLAPNVLIIRIGPEEGIYFKVNIKKIGISSEVQKATMDIAQAFLEDNRFNSVQAYERLLTLAFNKDQTLFTSWNFARKSWELIEELKNKLAKDQLTPLPYPAFEDGPDLANELLAQDGHSWIDEDEECREC